MLGGRSAGALLIQEGSAGALNHRDQAKLHVIGVTEEAALQSTRTA
jgi:hypothetical protein